MPSTPDERTLRSEAAAIHADSRVPNEGIRGYVQVRGSETDSRLAHNQELAGSTPALASIPSRALGPSSLPSPPGSRAPVLHGVVTLYLTGASDELGAEVEGPIRKERRS